MKILDLFCGAGGAAMGLHRAWPDAEIVGVDTTPQKNYPFKFVQADALTFPLDGYDFIWASPPCQKFTILRQLNKNTDAPDLIAVVRNKISEFGVPYVIENVPKAPLTNPVLLCGSVLGPKVSEVDVVFEVRRHRVFEASFPITGSGCDHNLRRVVVSVCGHGEPPWARDGRTPMPVSFRKKVMGIDWMNRDELAQAIPPAYSEFIARQLH